MKQYNDYSLSRKEYYARMCTPKNITFFQDLRKAGKRVLRVDLPVIFRDLKFGSRPDEVTAVLGEPRYIGEPNGISSSVFFYKETISDHKIITQLHFLGEEFFYACYTFRDKSSVEIMTIRKLLFEKYSKMNGDTAEKYDLMIDKDDNIISVNDNVNFNIVYLWGDKKVANAVSASLHRTQRKEESRAKQKLEDLLNKL